MRRVWYEFSNSCPFPHSGFLYNDLKNWALECQYFSCQFAGLLRLYVLFWGSGIRPGPLGCLGREVFSREAEPSYLPLTFATFGVGRAGCYAFPRTARGRLGWMRKTLSGAVGLIRNSNAYGQIIPCAQWSGRPWKCHPASRTLSSG